MSAPDASPADVVSPSDALRARAGRVLGAATIVHEAPPPTRKRPEDLTALGDVCLQMAHVIWRSELTPVRLDMVFNTLSAYQKVGLLERPELIERWTTYYGLNGDEAFEFTRFMTGDMMAFQRIKMHSRSEPEYFNL